MNHQVEVNDFIGTFYYTLAQQISVSMSKTLQMEITISPDSTTTLYFRVIIDKNEVYKGNHLDLAVKLYNDDGAPNGYSKEEWLEFVNKQALSTGHAEDDSHGIDPNRFNDPHMQDYYEQGSQSHEVDDFTQELLDSEDLNPFIR